MRSSRKLTIISLLSLLGSGSVPLVAVKAYAVSTEENNSIIDPSFKLNYLDSFSPTQPTDFSNENLPTNNFVEEGSNERIEEDLFPVGNVEEQGVLEIEGNLNFTSNTEAITAYNVAVGSHGTCSWTLADTGMLTISGGQMASLQNHTDVPWYDYRALITYIQIAGPVTVTSGAYLFSGLSNLSAITGLNLLDTSSVTNMSYMFQNCNNLYSLDLRSFNTSNVTDMSHMFDFWRGRNLDVSTFDTSKVTSMAYMFYQCTSVETLDLSSFDTAAVTSMSYMFQGCQRLTSLTGHFSTANVTRMDAMFAGANVLPSSVLNEFISSFDTRNTTNFSNMFSNCRSLTSFDNPFNLASAQDISNMFSNSGLVSFIAKNLNLLDNTYREVNANNMFRSCSAMVNFDSTDADFTNIVNSQYMFAECTNLEAITLPKISKYSPLSGTVTTLRGYMFSGCSKLVTVDLSNFYALNLNEFIRMNYMFQNCHSLKIVIFSTQFINRIVDVTALFMNCTSLEEFSGYFSANANVSMNNMFSGCTSLKKAEITSRYVESRNNMFLNCTNLEEVSFSTSFASVSAVNTASMFSGCQSLTKVSMGGNSMTNVTDMSNMFLNCLSLVDVDMSSWTVTPRTLTNMFSGCVQLEELDFMNWNTNNVTAANNMFADCVRLKKLHLGPNFRFWNTGVALPSIDTTSSVFSGGWIGENAELRFDSSVDFVTSYSGQSDTYIWEEAEPWIEVILPVSMMFYGEPLDGFLQSINSPEYSFTNLSSVPITLSIDSIQNGRDLDRLFLLHLHGEPYLYDIDLIIGGNIITVTAFDALTLNSGESEILTFSGDARAQSSESNPYFEIIFKLSI